MGTMRWRGDTADYRTIMSIINSPPLPQQPTIRRLSQVQIPGQVPGLLRTDEMDQADRTLKMLIGRDILVVCTRGTVIREA